jgi:hypothetical protein
MTYWDEDAAVVKPTWGAVVVASGPDLLYMQLFALSAEELDTVWDDWLRMVRRLRVTDQAPIEPVLDDLAETPRASAGTGVGVSPGAGERDRVRVGSARPEGAPATTGDPL